MASAPEEFLPPNGANVYQAAQWVPGTTVVQPPGMVQYVQYGGQQPGIPVYPLQQNRTVQPVEKFLKAEAKVLGAIQIFIGLMHIGLGTILAVVWGQYYVSIAVSSGYVFWGAVFFIISGSLSVSAEKHLSPALVKSSVGMNIISAIMAVAGIIQLILELALNSYWSVGAGISTLLLLFSLLEFCITVSTAHFGCLAACHSDQQPVVFVPYAVNGGVVAPREDRLCPPAYNATHQSPTRE